MKKKKEKKKRKEKTGPVQLSKVCLSKCEALFFFSSTSLIRPVIKIFIRSPVWSSTIESCLCCFGQSGNVKDYNL